MIGSSGKPRLVCIVNRPVISRHVIVYVVVFRSQSTLWASPSTRRYRLTPGHWLKLSIWPSFLP